MKRNLPNPGHPDRGFYYSATEYDRFQLNLANEWEEAQVERPGINHGLSQLACILRDTQGYWTPTPRDRVVAASVVQWIGTNCGFALLQRALTNSGMFIWGECPRSRHGLYPDPVFDEIDLIRRTHEASLNAKQTLFDLCEPS